MKILTIVFTLFFFSIMTFAQVQNQNLECSTTYSGDSAGGVSIGCVSKASIERDKAETKLLEIQTKLAELQLKKAQKEANENPVPSNQNQVETTTVESLRKPPVPTPQPKLTEPETNDDSN